MDTEDHNPPTVEPRGRDAITPFQLTTEFDVQEREYREWLQPSSIDIGGVVIPVPPDRWQKVAPSGPPSPPPGPPAKPEPLPAAAKGDGDQLLSALSSGDLAKLVTSEATKAAVGRLKEELAKQDRIIADLKARIEKQEVLAGIVGRRHP